MDGCRALLIRIDFCVVDEVPQKFLLKESDSSLVQGKELIAYN